MPGSVDHKSALPGMRAMHQGLSQLSSVPTVMGRAKDVKLEEAADTENTGCLVCLPEKLPKAQGVDPNLIPLNQIVKCILPGRPAPLLTHPHSKAV